MSRVTKPNYKEEFLAPNDGQKSTARADVYTSSKQSSSRQSPREKEKAYRRPVERQSQGGGDVFKQSMRASKSHQDRLKSVE